MCPQMDSAESLSLSSTAGANATYVPDHLHYAEALRKAGGEQRRGT